MVSTTSEENLANTEQLSQDIVQAVQAILDNPKFLETIKKYTEKFDLGDLEEFETDIDELLTSSNFPLNKSARTPWVMSDAAPTVKDPTYYYLIIPGMIIASAIGVIVSEPIREGFRRLFSKTEKKLKTELDKANTDKQTLQTEKTRLEDQLRDLQAQVDNIPNLKEELTQLREQITKKDTQIAIKESEKIRLEKDQQALETKYKSLQDEHYELKVQTEVKKQLQKSDVENQLQNLQEQLNELIKQQKSSVPQEQSPNLNTGQQPQEQSPQEQQPKQSQKVEKKKSAPEESPLITREQQGKEVTINPNVPSTSTSNSGLTPSVQSRVVNAPNPSNNEPPSSNKPDQFNEPQENTNSDKPKSHIKEILEGEGE